MTRLNYVTAYDTCSSEGEPGVQRIARVIQYIRKKDIRCIFHEEFVVPKVPELQQFSGRKHGYPAIFAVISRMSAHLSLAHPVHGLGQKRG